jgi:hypothetical protein
MENDKFSISGMPDYPEIPDDDDNGLNGMNPGHYEKLKRMGLSDAEIKRAMEELKRVNPQDILNELKNIPEKELLRDISRQLGVSEAEAKEVLDNLKNATEGIVGLFGGPGGPQIGIQIPVPGDTDGDDDEDFDEDDVDVEDEEFDEDEFEEDEEFEGDDPDDDNLLDNTMMDVLEDLFDNVLSGTTTAKKEREIKNKEKSEKAKNTAKKYNKGGSFSTLKLPKSFGVIPCERDEYMLESFIKAYGNGPYKTSMFPSNVVGYNLISAFNEIDELKVVSETDRFILFEGVPKNPIDSGIFVGVIKYNNEFQLVVPEYGNTYDFATGTLFNSNEDKYLYGVDEKTGELKLLTPMDRKKAEANISLSTYAEEKPILAIKDFGQVIATPSVNRNSSNKLRIGRIKSNESPMAKLFKRDFDLDLDLKVYDFYVKFNYEYPAIVLDEIADYLSGIDFNENPNLGNLPDNIRKWKAE